MTNTQAIELLKHLTDELEINGFGEVRRQANSRVEERFDLTDNLTPQIRLRELLDNVIQILGSVSSGSVPEIISTLNASLDSVNKIDNISIQLITDESYNLSNLPDYTNLIQSLNQVLQEIKDE
jgi:ABC-type transporter Mla subunit MlaD